MAGRLQLSAALVALAFAAGCGDTPPPAAQAPPPAAPTSAAPPPSSPVTLLDEAAPVASEAGEKLKAELDDLLDEIDDVLETNAEDFVKSYVQKGGQ